MERPCAAKAPPHFSPRRLLPQQAPKRSFTGRKEVGPERALEFTPKRGPRRRPEHRPMQTETRTGIKTDMHTDMHTGTHTGTHTGIGRRNPTRKSDAKIRRRPYAAPPEPTARTHRPNTPPEHTARTHRPNAPLPLSSVAKKGQPPRRVAARNGCRTRCGPQVTARSGLTSGRCPDPSSQSAPWSRACGRGT